MIIADLRKLKASTYPARRTTKNLVGGLSPIQAKNFCIGFVTLEPNGGQVPWHNHDQEEVYIVLDGIGEIVIGEEYQRLEAGQAVYISPRVFHQLTNIGDSPLKIIYCYGPAGEVSHWRQELNGTLPKAGIDAPSLPPGAQFQVSGKLSG